MKRARYGEAATQFQKAVELEPSEPAVRFALALAYMGSGKFSDAESQLRLAIGLKEDPRALHALGAALMYQERDSEAAPYLKRALEVSPRNYLSWWALGICYRRMGRSGESEQASRRGMEIVQAEIARNPRDGYVRSYLAYLSAVLRDRTRARSEIEQALRLSPDDSDVRWMAVLTYEALDDREASLAVLGSASRESLEELSRWPDVADLARDARFQQLMASRAP
jgi:Flp pilus assembly protein TadD